jgi:hypothetical protein
LQTLEKYMLIFCTAALTLARTYSQNETVGIGKRSVAVQIEANFDPCIEAETASTNAHVG